MQNKLFQRLSLKVAFIAIAAMMSLNALAQEKQLSLSGTVFEKQGKDSVPLEFALVSIPEFGLATSTDATGFYSFKNLPQGKAVVNVSYVGKVTIQQPITITGKHTKNFTLNDENFRLEEVQVTAQASQADGATASIIGKNAMEHLQATSLDDIMALLPGGRTSNQSLSSRGTVTIRGDGAANSLGTAVIRDGAPISTNGSLTTLNAAVSGGTSYGVDTRTITTDNIESVEVIRGIPSVEHGDLTSGAVIINSKAGREPLRITAKANPQIYMGTVSTGLNLKKGNGLNIYADYAINTNDPTQSYLTYQRVTSRLLWTKEFNKSFRTNTSFNFVYGNQDVAQNPDDDRYLRKSNSSLYGYTLNHNGYLNINKGIWKSLRYVVSGSYTNEKIFSQELVSSSVASSTPPYSGTETDGVILTSNPGQHIYDEQGNEITNFTGDDAYRYGRYYYNEYIEQYNIDSRAVNVFAKVVATLFKQSGYINNRILIGADFKTDGNVGKGKMFDPDHLPMRSNSINYATQRPRDYSKIPFMNQFGVYAEENFSWQLGLRELKIQAGLRYDHANIVGGTLQPRVNASFEVLPNKIWIHGGWGQTAKMPTLLYLYPEKQYMDYVNYNDFGSNFDSPLAMTTTKVYDTQNRDLKIAKNTKSEVGINMLFGGNVINITAYMERLRDGYSYAKSFNTYVPFMWATYSRNSDDTFTKQGEWSVLSSWSAPGNYANYSNKGIEFDIQFKRFEKINTTFSLSGAYVRTKNWTTAYYFHDNTSSATPDGRRPVLFYSNDTRSFADLLTTTFRITHNLPRIGFVVTLTGQVTWIDKDWVEYPDNYEIPLGYMGLEDGQSHFFDTNTYQTIDDFRNDPLWKDRLYNRSRSSEIKESYNPYIQFNLNVTKELGKFMRVSFFANNMFRSYPRRASHRAIGSYSLMNNRFYFGIELALTL